MFIVRLDGDVVTLTNTFDAAASYAETVRGVGKRVAITLALPDDLPTAVRSLARKSVSWDAGNQSAALYASMGA